MVLAAGDGCVFCAKSEFPASSPLPLFFKNSAEPFFGLGLPVTPGFCPVID